MLCILSERGVNISVAMTIGMIVDRQYWMNYVRVRSTGGIMLVNTDVPDEIPVPVPLRPKKIHMK
jgi:hypothetical protein